MEQILQALAFWLRDEEFGDVTVVDTYTNGDNLSVDLEGKDGKLYQLDIKIKECDP